MSHARGEKIEIILENAISNHLTMVHGVDKWLFSNRASGGLQHLLTTLGSAGDLIAIPAITCHDIAQTAISAGLEISFYDISLSDYNSNFFLISESLKSLPRPPKFLLFVHSFGHRFEAEEVYRFCHLNGITLIEDRCQFAPNHSTPSRADVVLTSFGHTKPIRGGGGGALGFRDESIYLKVKESRASWRDVIVNSDRAKNFSLAYYAELDKEKRGEVSRANISKVTEEFSDFVAHGSTGFDHISILKAIEKLGTSNLSRIKNACFLSEAFSNLPTLHLPEYLNGSIPWRYTFLAEDFEHREKICAILRYQGLHVSAWYRNLGEDYPSISTQKFSNAVEFERRVINLWIDESVDDQYLQKCAETIRGLEL